MPKTKPTTACPHCGKPLNPSHGNQLYHPECRTEIRQQVAKESSKRWYEKNRTKILKARRSERRKEDNAQ